VSVFKRQIIKGSLSNFLGIGLGVLNNIWLFPLAFTLEELGIYRWVERTAVLIAAIALLGMHRTYVRYQSQFQGEEASQFLSNIIAIVAAVAGISGIGFTLFAGRIAVLLEVPVADEIFILGAVIAGSMTYTLGLSIASSAKRISVPFFMKNVGIRLTLLISAYLVSKDHLDFSFWMKIFALVHMFVGLGVLFYSVLLKGIPLRKPKPLNKGLGQELATFAGSGVIMAVMTMSLATIDSQMIASLMSYEALGIYSIAFFIGSFVDGIRRPVSQALSPQFANLWNEGNTEAIAKMYGRTSRVLMAVALASFLLIVPNIEFIFGLIPNPERFEDAKSVVVLVLLSRVIDYSFGSNGELLSNGPYFKWNLLAITGLVALLIGLNYVLIPKYGLDGAGYALLISYAVFNISKAVYLFAKENMQPFSTVQLTLVCIALPTYLLAKNLAGPSTIDFIYTNGVVAMGLAVGFILLRKRI
jgi:O-antigen/teichoic acid export membrane protein